MKIDMFAITESHLAQLEQYQFQSALLTNKMLTHKGECLQQGEQIPQERSLGFSSLYLYSCLSARKGVATCSMLLHCVPQL